VWFGGFDEVYFLCQKERCCISRSAKHKKLTYNVSARIGYFMDTSDCTYNASELLPTRLLWWLNNFGKLFNVKINKELSKKLSFNFRKLRKVKKLLLWSDFRFECPPPSTHVVKASACRSISCSKKSLSTVRLIQFCD